MQHCLWEWFPPVVAIGAEIEQDNLALMDSRWVVQRFLFFFCLIRCSWFADQTRWLIWLEELLTRELHLSWLRVSDSGREGCNRLIRWDEKSHAQQIQANLLLCESDSLLASKNKGIHASPVFIVISAYVLSFTEGEKDLLDYLHHLSLGCGPGTASRGPSGVMAEALNTAWLSSSTLPRLAPHRWGERAAHTAVQLARWRIC